MDGDAGILGQARLAGYRKWEGTDPFEDHAGPFFYRQNTDGQYSCAFLAGPTHVNAGGAIHGGCLMTFADFSLFIFTKPALTDVSAVTISFSSEFVGAGFEGDLIEAEGEMVRETGSLVFARGTILTRRSEGETVTLLTYSGVLKKIRSGG
ncbi:MAG: PaaI family thioesterase [Alphaproteobacteria bacterium]